MAKPPTSTRSIRLADEAWDWLAERAPEVDETINSYIADMVARERGIVGHLERIDLSADDRARVEAWAKMEDFDIPTALGILIDTGLNSQDDFAEMDARDAAANPKPDPPPRQAPVKAEPVSTTVREVPASIASKITGVALASELERPAYGAYSKEAMKAKRGAKRR